MTENDEKKTQADKRIPSRWQSSNASLVFGVLTASFALGGVALSFLVALARHPRLADIILASAVILLGLARAFWPGRPWYASRNKALDVTIYLLVAAGLLLLSPWASTLQAL